MWNRIIVLSPFFILLAVTVLISLPVFFFDGEKGVRKGSYDNEIFRNELLIKNFMSSSYKNNNLIATMKADSLKIHNKRIGFFRLGLGNVVKVKNATLNVYNLAPKSENASILESLKNYFSREAVRGMSSRPILGVRIDNVALNFLNDGKIQSSIKSKHASFGGNDTIIFQGDVAVETPSGKLFTEHLTLLPTKGLIKTEHHFFLEDSFGTKGGFSGTWDLALQPVTVKQRNH